MFVCSLETNSTGLHANGNSQDLFTGDFSRPTLEMSFEMFHFFLIENAYIDLIYICATLNFSSFSTKVCLRFHR